MERELQLCAVEGSESAQRIIEDFREGGWLDRTALLVRHTRDLVRLCSPRRCKKELARGEEGRSIGRPTRECLALGSEEWKDAGHWIALSDYVVWRHAVDTRESSPGAEFYAGYVAADWQPDSDNESWWRSCVCRRSPGCIRWDAGLAGVHVYMLVAGVRARVLAVWSIYRIQRERRARVGDGVARGLGCVDCWWCGCR